MSLDPNSQPTSSRSEMTLYSYFRSSASYRVRIALALKNIPYNYEPVHLVKDGGHNHREEYLRLNPRGELPTLVDHSAGDFVLSQSMAILQYLDDRFPETKIFPTDPKQKALCLQICEGINSGIQPLQNIRLLKQLSEMGAFKSDEDKASYCRDLIYRGFTAIEKSLVTDGPYCLGDTVTAADIFLIPQVYNARRFNVVMEDFPQISKVERACAKLEAFQAADPHCQIDTPDELKG